MGCMECCGRKKDKDLFNYQKLEKSACDAPIWNTGLSKCVKFGDNNNPMILPQHIQIPCQIFKSPVNSAKPKKRKKKEENSNWNKRENNSNNSIVDNDNTTNNSNSISNNNSRNNSNNSSNNYNSNSNTKNVNSNSSTKRTI